MVVFPFYTGCFGTDVVLLCDGFFVENSSVVSFVRATRSIFLQLTVKVTIISLEVRMRSRMLTLEVIKDVSSNIGLSTSLQVYVPTETSTTEEFVKAFLQMCKALLVRQRDLPLFVVCPLTSRFELDIDHVFSKLNAQSDFITLLIHFGTEDSLPKLSTAARFSRMEKYKHRTFIDIAFTRDAHIYKCRMNDNAKEMIRTLYSETTRCC